MRFLPLAILPFLLFGCTERPLTGSEAAFLGTVHGNNVQFDDILIVKGGLADARPNDGAVALGNKIHYNSNTYRENFVPDDDVTFIEDLVLLAHEVTHIWQYNSGKTPKCTVSELAREHSEFGDTVYVYPTPLSASKSLTSYRCEQQAQIVGDWVLYRALNRPEASTYEAVIRRSMPVDELLAKSGLKRRD
ncbi:hypothetical protein [Tritonibacter horizontis]|uniref:DUF4157 domain-containing protein n=1 Tax=Tritonibacter horizontis TaxID=1768241 RepID=A0A132BWL9_9RHOB|nr:hypothetical protein [Tritonibacter horizontis]KUP92694.1 hypothetical protein TRIHO_24320 [Tritonibacter horizontis]